MAGAQFEYDERGSTSLFVIFCFYLVILLPLTYYCWPWRKKAKARHDKVRRCRCEACVRKEDLKRKREPSEWSWFLIKMFVLAVAWALMAALFYQTFFKAEVETVEWDPYAILGLDKDAEISEIKKRYRELSKTEHPDKGGDPQRFVQIAKAYQALTDEEARENYAKYGNPDGPGATTFGIALPKWIVSKEYGIWVLAAYGLVFMIILPTAVGIWWYNSIKYTSESVLIDTQRFRWVEFARVPSMNMPKIIQLLSASFEFAKEYNKEVVLRPTDNYEIPDLLKLLPEKIVDKKKQNHIYQAPFSAKTRALLYAHLCRLHQHLNQNTLLLDLNYNLKKCPMLVQDMINTIVSLNFIKMQGKISRCPTLDTMDLSMKLSPMLVQALPNERTSPLLQLPHISEDMLRLFLNKKTRIRTCFDLANLSEADRRDLLMRRVHLAREQYEDVLTVLASMPKLHIVDAHCEVPGEDDKQEITERSYVSMRVKLQRSPMLDLNNLDANANAAFEAMEDERANEESNDRQKAQANASAKTGGGGAGGKKKKMTAQQKAKEQARQQQRQRQEEEQRAAVEAERTAKREAKKAEENEGEKEDDEADDADNESDREEEEHASSSDSDNEEKKSDDDDDMLAFDDKLIKRDLSLETKSKVTHPVHCPYFPEEKYEWWWAYIIDKRNRQLITPPQQVCTLIESEEVELRFGAPEKRGTYTYTVVVKSDSYIDQEYSKDVKFDVKEARIVETHPQWEQLSDNEDENRKVAADALGGELSEGHEHTDSDVSFTEESASDSETSPLDA